MSLQQHARKMSNVSNLLSIFYEIPTDAILEHRKHFYSTEKEATEPVAEWFCRIRNAIEHCEFGGFSNFLIIDKFFCGLDDDAKRWLRKTKSWSTDQLYHEILDSKFLIESIDSQDAIAVNRLGIDEVLKIELDDAVSRKCCAKSSIPTLTFFSLYLYGNRKVQHRFSTVIPITAMRVTWMKVIDCQILYNVIRSKWTNRLRSMNPSKRRLLGIK